ncbi:MAG: DNA topoisomerase 3 [Chloroflexi bacterium]|nr:DNA topoisomerase 3 [Chloroflexota bacterium]
MATTLVVAEKPSVGRDLATSLPGTFEKHEGYLEADGFVVTWAVGHLVALAEPDEYDERYKKWRKADLPIVPTEFKLRPADQRSSKQLAIIQRLMRRRDVNRVVNACDAGREGELIFVYIWQTAGVDKPVERLWISSLTPRAIGEGFARLRPGSEMASLEQAARSRSEADWLIGMNATRAATIRGRLALGGVVSLGRVQTPTLALLVRRESEVCAVVPEDYWLVQATFDGQARARYAGRWFNGEQTRLKTAEQAETIAAKVRDKPGVVRSVERKEQTEAPPLLYDLTSLQRDANRRFGFSASRTLRAAQSLYEDKKSLTYPRTSSRYLSSDLIQRLKPTAEMLAPLSPLAEGARYALGLEKLPLRRVVDDAKIGDHHAIIPTLSTHHVEKFSEDERRIFDLVARRFLAVFHPPARYARTTVITEVESESFRTRGRVTLEVGWRGLYGAVPDEPLPRQEDDETEGGELPPLEQGQPVRCVEAESEMRTTKPPPRYNEATLLSAMETAGKLVDDSALREAMKERGLGTPATRAEIIETLIRREYVGRNGKELTPTPTGMQVIALLETHPLTSAELTGDWEQRLNEMEHGRADRSRFMRDVADFTRQTVEQISSLEPGEMRPERVVIGACPRCGARTGSVIRENSKGYGCTSWKSKDEPGCGFVIWKKVAGRSITPEIARQLVEQGRTNEVLTGFRSRAGKPFRARLLLDQDGQVVFDMPPRPGGREAPTDGTAPPSHGAAPAERRPPAAGEDTSPDEPAPTRQNGQPAPNGAARPPRNGRAVATGESEVAHAASRAHRAMARRAATPESPPAPDAARPAAQAVAPPAPGVDPADYLRQAGLEVIDKRPIGSLWVVDGDPPSPALVAARASGVRFTFAKNGGRATRHRPAWFSRPESSPVA